MTLTNLLAEFSLSEEWNIVSEAILSRSNAILTSFFIVGLGLLLHLVFRLAIRPWRRRLSLQAMLILRKSIAYTITIIVAITILQQFGLKITALLGAAGILGIAIGFAAQTSLSNIISGIFLVWEKPFKVGDIIQVGQHKGVVQSIDLLSLSLRTFDNLVVRLPNETLVKGELVNITKYPIRRYDIKLGVAYRENPERVLAVLKDVSTRNTHVLEEPEPLVAFTGFGESQLEFFLGVWHERDDFIPMRNSILNDIKLRFDQEGIEIPFPHRVLVTRTEEPPSVVAQIEPATAEDSTNEP